MKQAVKALFAGVIMAGILYAALFLIPVPVSQNITWGVNFSQMHAEALGLDWKRVYTAIIEELGAKRLRLMVNWDFVEGREGQYFFNDVDWQVKEAMRHGAKLIPVIGMKTGRWPECHLPGWAKALAKERQQEKILAYIAAFVARYKSSPAIEAWQIENEPFFKFGSCPWYDDNFLRKEVALLKKLDPIRPIIITDSGEQSLWLKAAGVGDIVGTTIYRHVWVNIAQNIGFYATFPLPPSSYWLKSRIVNGLFGKKVISVELQAEPWTPRFFYDEPLSVQEQSMNSGRFSVIIEYAKQTGFDTFYLWGAEWWYWLKEIQHKPDMWNMAKDVINKN